MIKKKKTPEQKEKQRRVNFLNAMRKAFVFSDSYKAVQENSISSETGSRGGDRYTCSDCAKAFPKKDMQIDHHVTVTPFHLRQWEMTEKMIYERIFCEDDNLFYLCSGCHKSKTAKERVLRSAAKKAAKKT